MLLFWACSPEKESANFELKTATDANGYTYEYVTGDPLNARIYTLENGLKVFLTKYQDAPRIQTLIGVNAGGSSDPADATGLAHYLEHIMFKGTTRFGTLDYEKEKPLLDSIERMFEYYRTLTDPEERKQYYAKIDQVSNEAAQYAIANEYDKLVNLIGAKGTNAYTNDDRTVYMNDIPANELERWLKIEQFRFREIIPRLFHTELEAVYEEKNIGMDSDYRKAYEAMNTLLFQNHPYGTQSVIGTIEHLKNPSIKEIIRYFDKYYVPNNTAISLSGDLDFEESIALIDQYFGDWIPVELAPLDLPEESDISQVRSMEVLGPDQEWVSIGFRMPGSNSVESLKASVMDMLLNNSKAGLIDINLLQKQKVLDGGSYVNARRDYSVLNLTGNPREGQSLDEVKELLLAQIDSIKQGKFDDWLIEAVITDLEVSQMRGYEQNFSRAHAYIVAQNQQIPWKEYVNKFDRMRQFSKQDIVDFADKWFKDNNYAVVYKRTGEDNSIVKVEKPQITKVSVNRDINSAFFQELEAQTPPRLQPLFLDYEKDIQKGMIAGKVPVHYTENKDNALFSMYYLFDMGKTSNPTLPLAVDYLQYLGTSTMSAEEFQKELYKIGCRFSVYAADDITYVILSGLEANMEKGLQLFETFLADAQADQEALDEMVKGILRKREDAKKDKYELLYEGLMNYAAYGPNSPVKMILNESELKALKGEDLTEIIHGLTSYEHRVLYYGRKPLKEVEGILEQNRKLPEQMKALPEAKKFEKIASTKHEVFWTHYDMVQAEIMFINKNIAYDKGLAPSVRMYNEYFGGGMGSIVFQEMREARALAYSVYSNFGSPSKKEENFQLMAYIGTQADKLPEAMRDMLELINDMPVSEKSFSNAKDGLISKLESERITKTSILFNYENARKLGHSYDIRKDIYESAKNMSLEDVQKFQEQYVKDRKYRIVVLGSRSKLDLNTLKKYGDVKELSIEEILGY